MQVIRRIQPFLRTPSLKDFYTLQQNENQQISQQHTLQLLLTQLYKKQLSLTQKPELFQATPENLSPLDHQPNLSKKIYAPPKKFRKKGVSKPCPIFLK